MVPNALLDRFDVSAKAVRGAAFQKDLEPIVVQQQREIGRIAHYVRTAPHHLRPGGHGWTLDKAAPDDIRELAERWSRDPVMQGAWARDAAAYAKTQQESESWSHQEPQEVAREDSAAPLVTAPHAEPGTDQVAAPDPEAADGGRGAREESTNRDPSASVSAERVAWRKAGLENAPALERQRLAFIAAAAERLALNLPPPAGELARLIEDARRHQRRLENQHGMTGPHVTR